MPNITDLILENEKLIYKIIGRYQHYFELDDLYQVAVMGMIKAYNNYNSGYNTKFTSYAYPYILGEVIRYINEFRMIKVNRNSKLLYSKILNAKEVLAQRLMKEPSTYELSLFLEMDEALIEETIMSNMSVDSLDRIVSEDGKELELYERLGVSDKHIENYDLTYGLDNLDTDDRKIIIARYYGDMSQKEVGDNLGMYQVEVSRREKKILERLRNDIAA